MKRIATAITAALAFTVLAAPASASTCTMTNEGRTICSGTIEQKVAKHQTAKRVAKRTAKRPVVDPNGNRGIISVSTAANITIKVAADFAAPIQGVIADLKARGITPKQIHCYATGGHVRGSYHYQGRACDFDFYRGCMGCSAKWTRHINDIVARHGLRNGCSFGDCGHIDAGSRYAKKPWPRVIASNAPYTE